MAASSYRGAVRREVRKEQCAKNGRKERAQRAVRRKRCAENRRRGYVAEANFAGKEPDKLFAERSVNIPVKRIKIDFLRRIYGKNRIKKKNLRILKTGPKRFGRYGGRSMEKFIAGMLLGTAVGALWVANSNKTRALVKKGQEEVREKMDAYIDEKLAAMEVNAGGESASEKKGKSTRQTAEKA